ncbi:hypothetical protein BURKHO8Y_240159 [Burkholderia sp. 8Y]|nr:hypothetical protein BURKHO8Y_240159 [Burkholderia sp. 8Y]
MDIAQAAAIAMALSLRAVRRAAGRRGLAETEAETETAGRYGICVSKILSAWVRPVRRTRSAEIVTERPQRSSQRASGRR